MARGLKECSVCHTKVRARRLPAHLQRVHGVNPEPPEEPAIPAWWVIWWEEYTQSSTMAGHCKLCEREVLGTAAIAHVRSHHLDASFEDLSASPPAAPPIFCALCGKRLSSIRYRQEEGLYQCVGCHYVEIDRRGLPATDLGHLSSSPSPRPQKRRRRSARVIGQANPLPAAPIPSHKKDALAPYAGYIRVFQGGRVSPR